MAENDKDRDKQQGQGPNTEQGAEQEESNSSSQIAEKNGSESHLVTSTKLSGMYKEWFLDYASYVILERAVPHIGDGLKPVQRRIMHAMKRLDDGRYNKVANIIGHTMQFHPHGDASIGDALVQLGQKDLLVDTQGNWGNIHTGDSSAAPRYIEARLSPFALDVVFNPKTTGWKPSYDGRNKEPITLPVKFPLLLAQGVEGIAVGLASKIMPHNFIELIDASIAYLQGKDFELLPDFPTGGLADCSRYNEGLRGGQVRVRCRISKPDSKTLAINDLPFGKTTGTLIDSILKANEKGKIKIKKIDDNTAENVEILIHLAPNVSQDKTIDALYAFTDCEISISPNACIIENDRPHFIGVKEILKHNTESTMALLRRELEIRLNELEDSWHMSSLERIFIEERIYRQIEDSESWEQTVETIDKGLEPFKKLLRREVTREDIIKLTEIRIKRITKHDAKKADEHIKALEAEMEEVNHKLAHLREHTIEYYKNIKKKHGKGRERRTEIRSFDTIEATKVVVKNSKLYVNRKEGFVGLGLKKDEFVCDCSDIDDVIVFMQDGKYMVSKVEDKAFFGKNIIHVGIFKRNDERTIYNAAYVDGKTGTNYVKRFAVSSATRDREYDLTQGHKYSRVLHFSANPNGEAETIKIFHKPKPKLKKKEFEFDFSELDIKNRNARGNILTRHEIHRTKVLEKGESTLGGVKVWFDPEVLRLNYDEKGQYLGEFQDKKTDQVLALTKSGTARLTNWELTNHYPADILQIEKLDPEKTLTVVYWEADQKYYYIKRFQAGELGDDERFIGDNPDSKLLTMTEDELPRLAIKFGGKDKGRKKQEVDVDEFIGVKSPKARGKRLTTYQLKTVDWLEPKEAEKNADDDKGEKDKAGTKAEPQTKQKAKEPPKNTEPNSSKAKEETKASGPKQAKPKSKPSRKKGGDDEQMTLSWDE